MQFVCRLTILTAGMKSQLQQYQRFLNGPESVYQQRQLQTNSNNQKWYYSSNNQATPFQWYWTKQDTPSSNYYQNTVSFNQGNQLSNWACGRNQLSSRFARIMGGQDAVPHSYPWMVSITKRSLNNIHLCGGVLLTRRHVLTAAHCMEDFDDVSDLNVIAGTYYITDKRNPVAAIAINVHPLYEPETFANDIAVVTLLTPLPDNNPWIGTICLPPDDVPGKNFPPMNSAGVAIGWGSTYFGGDPSVTLKQVVLPILETTKWPCNIYITYAQGQICAGELSGGVDTCQADSGGPLMMENADNRWEVVGITSFGKSCGKPNTPGIYTRVSTYNSFIRSIVGLSSYAPYNSSSSNLVSAKLFISILFLIVFFLV
ncbi:unnamed protein product [Adineta ricciae]|uniref:Peptidase S1 domain-containing protein n=1 Tax=Adineta ricciae TaxID=249248 RepID=A0A814F980_ADIRI|nr:unnamed protein product [Adineta ricciae]